jgi:hypothetical protein
MSRFLRSFLYVIVLVSLAGCGGKGSAVTGTVTFEDGTPLGVGVVVFESDSQSFSGRIGTDGTYSLTGASAKDGVADGTYAVTVVKAIEATADSQGNPTARDLIDAKYAQSKTSELSCSVKGTTKYDIKVSKPKS